MGEPLSVTEANELSIAESVAAEAEERRPERVVRFHHCLIDLEL